MFHKKQEHLYLLSWPENLRELKNDYIANILSTYSETVILIYEKGPKMSFTY